VLNWHKEMEAKSLKHNVEYHFFLNLFYLLKKKISEQSGTHHMRVCASRDVRPSRRPPVLPRASALSRCGAQRKSSLTRPYSWEGRSLPVSRHRCGHCFWYYTPTQKVVVSWRAVWNLKVSLSMKLRSVTPSCTVNGSSTYVWFCDVLQRSCGECKSLRYVDLHNADSFQ